jgi:amino acid transporter
VPAAAAAAIAAAAIATILLIYFAGTSVAFSLFAWSGTVGTLVLLVAYAIFTAGAWNYLCVRGPRHGQPAARLDYIVPVLGLIVLGYTLYRNVLPWPSSTSGQVIAILAAIWVAAAIAAIVAVPRHAERIGDRLAHDEGLVFSTGKIAQTVAEMEMNDPRARPA